LQVEFESIAFGGSGVAREEGKVIFVKGGVPKDVLEVRIIKDKGSYAEAIIESVITPSPERAEPVCEVFGTCGGCQLQNLGYEAQTREKEHMLERRSQEDRGLCRPDRRADIPLGERVFLPDARQARRVVLRRQMARRIQHRRDAKEGRDNVVPHIGRAD